MNLRQLQQLSATGHLDLYYSDESTFSMNPCLPYGWQAKGETVGIFPQGNRKINVFGIFRANNQCWPSFSSRNINGEFVAGAIDEFCRRRVPGRPSVLVLDNAAMHHGHFVKAKLAEWEEKGLYLFYLPKYAPHLNLAERFWRKAKYEWLKPADYLSFDKFKQKITDIFMNIGSKYKVNFTVLECHNNSA